MLAELPPPARAQEALNRAVQALERGDSRAALEILDDLDGGALIDQLTGVAQLLAGDPYRAAAVFERAIAAAPNAYLPRRWAARALAQKAEHAAAIEMFEAAFRLQEDDFEAQAELAACYVALGDPDRAEVICRRGLGGAPDDPDLQRGLAQSLVAQGREAEAAQVLHAVVQSYPDDVVAQALLGRTELALGHAHDAQSAFEALLRQVPESTEGLAGMAEALAHGGELQAAHGYVLRALAAAPDRPDLQVLQARIAVEQGHLELAERAAANALALDPTATEAQRLGVRASLERRHFGQAARFARALLATEPGDPGAVAALAFEAILAKRADEAVADIAPHLEATPHEPWLHLAAGCAHLAKRRAETAVAHLIEVVRQREDHPWAQRALGLAYEYGRRPRLDVARATETLLRTGDLGDDYEAYVAEGDDTTDILEPFADHPTPVPAGRASDPLPPLVEAAVNQVLGAGDPVLPQGITPPPERRDSTPGSKDGSTHLAARSAESPPRPALDCARGLVELLAGERGLARYAEPLERLLDFDANPLVLAVVGSTGVGKSTFVNALVGDALVPPRTSVPHLLRYGQRSAARLIPTDADAPPERLGIEDLRARIDDGLVTPERVARIELFAPIDELTRVRILDVPAEVDVDGPALHEIDAILWLGAVDQSMDAWHRARSWLEARDVPALAVCTRADQADPGDVDRRVADVRSVVGEHVVDVVVVSAQRGLAALRARDVPGVRASGLSRLHRVLARSFFDHAGALRGLTLERESRRVAARALVVAGERIEASRLQAESVQAQGEGVEEDRKALQRFVEVDVSVRLSTGLHEAVAACGPELMSIRQAGADHFTRLHQLDALRTRVRRSVVAVVDEVRGEVDERIQGFLERNLQRWEALFEEAGVAGGARVGALHGILDAYRMVALETVFGRHRAYLEGWIDQAPLEVMLDDDAALGEHSTGTVGDMVEELRTRGLRLGNARAPRLDNFGSMFFEALQGFIDETAAELRVARVDLAQRLVEPLERFRTRGR